MAMRSSDGMSNTLIASRMASFSVSATTVPKCCARLRDHINGSPRHLAPLALPAAGVGHCLRIVLAFLHEAILRRSAERFAVAANRFWLT